MPVHGIVTQLTFEDIGRHLADHAPRQVEIRPPLRGASVALTLVPGREDGLDLLFIKRAEHPGDPWSGQMALPGGRRDRTDPDLLRTAIRETNEETGIDLTSAMLLGALDDLAPVSPHLPPIVVRPFAFALVHRPVIVRSHEVALHLWVPLEQLASSLVTAPVHVRGRHFTMPGYQVGPHFIWGMTERIVTTFLGRIGLGETR